MNVKDLGLTYVSMYHYVRPIINSYYNKIKGLELVSFKQQLDFFINNDFEFIDSYKILDKRLAGKDVLLTFDDGYIDHYRYVYPILKENGIRGVFSIPGKIIREKKVLDVNKIHFILACADSNKVLDSLKSELNYYRGVEFDYPSNDDLFEQWGKPNQFDTAEVIFIKRILQIALPEQLRNIIVNKLFCEYVTDNEEQFVNELYMNYEQIKEMKKNGMEIAYHGYDHVWLNYLNSMQIRTDVEKALDVFDGIIADNWGVAYPYGGYSEELIVELKKHGAKYGFTTNFDVYNQSKYDLFHIPRLDTNFFPPVSEKYLGY